MKKYEAFQIIEDTRLFAKTDDPFKWFPELEKMFEHFDVKEMRIEIDSEEEVSYLIRKVREHEVPDLSMGGMLRKCLSEIDEEM